MTINELALKSFSNEQNIDLQVLKGRSFGEVNSRFQCDPYAFEIGQNFQAADLAQILSKITHLKMTTLRRFSNSLVAISNMYALATQQHIPHIVLPNQWFIREGWHTIGGIRILNLARGQEFTIGDNDVVLTGEYFYTQSLKNLYGKHRHAENIEALRDFLVLDTHTAPLPEQDLVIHVRSGDLFSAVDGCHPSYGQPPLAFYKMVISTENPKQIHLVFEDKGNPVINGIIDYVAHQGIPCHTVSGSLESDINFLLKAQHLVAGRGTFLPGVTSISRNIRKVYFFDSGYNHWGKKNLRVIKVTDTSNRYKDLLLRQWKNTAEQHKMMLDYSIENLSYQIT